MALTFGDIKMIFVAIMEQANINNRLKFLVDKIGLSSRAFSELIGESPTNTHNYIGARQAEPRAGYLTKVLSHFSDINPAWLMLGEGEPFKEGSNPTQNQKNISSNKNIVANSEDGKAIHNNYDLTECEKERDKCKAELDKAQTEIQSLRDQLARADALIVAKDEMLDLLRGGINRPN